MRMWFGDDKLPFSWWNACFRGQKNILRNRAPAYMVGTTYAFVYGSLRRKEGPTTLGLNPGISLPNRTPHPALSPDALTTLREGLATCRSKRGLTPEANEAIVSLCAGAHQDGWTAEQLLMAVKDACYSSPEIAHLTSTSERDAFLAKIVSSCIKEYYKGNGQSEAGV